MAPKGSGLPTDVSNDGSAIVPSLSFPKGSVERGAGRVKPRTAGGGDAYGHACGEHGPGLAGPDTPGYAALLMSLAHDSRPTSAGRVGVSEITDAVYAISEAAATMQDLTVFYRRVQEIISTLMPARNFYIALVDATGTQVAMPYFVDEQDTVPGTNFRPMGNGLTEYIIRTKKPFFFGPGEQKEYRNRGLFEILGKESIVWMGAPLLVGDTVIGMPAVQSYTVTDRYTTADLDVLSYVSRQVASAIHRKRTLDLLAESNRKLDTLVNNLPGIVYRCANDAAWTMEYLSDGVRELTGYPAAEFIGNRVRSFASIIEAEDGEAIRAAVEIGLAAHRPYSLSYRIRTAGGETRWVFERGSGVFDGERLVALEGFIADVTEARRAEAERASLAEQLRQAQKMESVGLLAGGVAHDLNNLLMPILGYADVLREGEPAGSPRREMLAEIWQAAGRARDLVRQLLTFSRRQVLELTTVDLAAVVRSFRKILRATIREEIEIEAVLPPEPLLVRADPVQIEQVLLNLAVNAQDAMSAASADRHVLAIAVKGQGESVILTVSDTGVGMSPEALRRAFEPFFTTKAPGKGTGLGLSTVYGIVMQHGGQISVSSTPGKGTAFRILFPRVAASGAGATGGAGAAGAAGREQAAGSRQAIRAPWATAGTERVLLVEDEEAVRELSRIMLEREGYRVIACGGGEEALAAARAHPIDILVTDVIMAGMNGRDLADMLLRERPGMPVLFTSGYTDDVIARHGIRESGTHFLSKPYTPRELAARIRALLDGRH